MAQIGHLTRGDDGTLTGTTLGQSMACPKI